MFRGPPILPFNRHRGWFPDINRPGREGHSPPPSAEAKSEQNNTSTAPLYLHGEVKEKFIC